MQALRATAALSVWACALALAACGGSSGAPAAPVQGNFGGDLRDVARLSCRDWKAANPAERSQILRSLRSVIGGQVTGRGANGRGAVLPDDKAYSLFDRYCREHFARGFSLYKLYGQASGFAGD